MEDYICPWCLQGFNDEGYCACGDLQEVHQAWLEEGRTWAKEYLPEDWYQYPWKIIKSDDGILTWQGRTLDAYCWAVLGQHPGGWYGVVVLDPDERNENDLFYFSLPGEPPQVGPFPTEEAASQALLYRVAQLGDYLESLRPVLTD